ncbi:MAG: phosphoenolpyruvate--protein phosphotransferase [Verrucomicrobia bacterium]|nr:MAG: phosphoenolpyruvate--protein phosphotransferase [Verrucomicrobiota bacterium]
MPERPSDGERVYQGVPVSGGVAHGRVIVLGQSARNILRRELPEADVDAELARLQSALTQTRRDLLEVQRQVEEALGRQEASVFDAHLLVLEDPMLLDEVHRLIRDHRVNAESAYQQVSEKYAAALGALEDDYLRERAADIRDISGRVLDHLLGHRSERDLRSLPEPCIILAPDLAPSTTATLDRAHVLGFATDGGGTTSHTAIMARKLGIPAVVGLGDITARVRNGEYALLDGHGGVLTINPTDQTLFEYGQLKQRRAALDERLGALREQPAVTLDGHSIHLAANIDHPDDTQAVRACGAEGVGLFRSEFLFLNRRDLPSEDEQFEAYRRVAEAVAPNPAMIRTLDIGGDKLPAAWARLGEQNPFLGWRAIRICLDQPELFRTQLRAILRASAHGRVKIMFPMISSIAELRGANASLERCREELRDENVPFDPGLEVGIMIEVPGAALIADVLAREAQFLSIGTNDLTGYTLAVDRMNDRVAPLFAPTHPGVLRLIEMTIAAARRHGRWVGVCGEMAGEPALVPLLLGLGVDELSVTPASVPSVKFLLRRLRVAETQALARFALDAEDAEDVRQRSRALAMQAAPELFAGN